LNRLLYIVPTFLALTFLVFTVLSLAPGDPVMAILGPNATDEQIEQKREELGLNDNLIVRYGKYMGNLAQGDFGESWISGNKMSAEFAARLPNTLQLLLYALTLTICVGIPLGVVSAVWQYSLLDKATLIFALTFLSIPSFFLALIVQIIFSLNLRWLPVTGVQSFKHFILPSIVLAVSRIATQVRMTRSSMLDVIQQDYIRTAYAKGSNKTRTIIYHALRNGLLPVVTSIGNSVGGIVSGAVTVETIFAIPGLGSMLVNAVRMKDIPMVMGPIIFIALLVCVINMLVDMLYAFIDPRVRLQYSQS
jgi:peptide/nickel transport system permease protein